MTKVGIKFLAFKKQFLLPFGAVLCSIPFLTGCGDSLNILFVGGEDGNGVNNLVLKARSAWDAGDLETAVEFADKALAQNPHDEKAGILRANLYMAEANLAPFDIVIGMIKNTGSGSGESTDVLGGLATIVSITDEEYKKMGTTTAADSATTVFDTSLFIPKNPGSVGTEGDPRNDVAILKSLSLAIQTICPFVDPSVLKNDESKATTDGYDARHVCTPAKANLRLKGKSNFVFAVAHLMESLLYNQVVLDGGDASFTLNLAGSNESGLAKRSAALSAVDPTSDVTKYLASVTELQKNFNAIFSSDSKSMFAALMLNMRVVSETLAKISGVPASVTSSITGSFDKIKDAAKTIPGKENNSDDFDAQIQGLQKQMNDNTAKTISKEIDGLDEADFPTGDEFTNTKTSLCGALEDFSQGATTNDKCSE